MTIQIEFDGKFSTYQQYTQSTAVYPEQGKPIGLLYTVLGLAGESGEVAEKIKKLIRDSDFLITGNVEENIKGTLKKELGDVLWYLARICEELDLELSGIAVDNLVKLFDRLDRGVLHGSGDMR